MSAALISSLVTWSQISMTDRKPLSIEQQADFVDGLIMRCQMRGGAVADETTIILNKSDVDHLADLASRLLRMAPHEDSIRRVVMGK